MAGLNQQEEVGSSSSQPNLPSADWKLAALEHAADPSVPHEDGTCFWNKLPMELMQLVLELVYPTGQKMRIITREEWIKRENAKQSTKKRKDRTAGKPFPGAYVEKFLNVSKNWFQAASTLFHSRADFVILPTKPLDAIPSYLYMLTTISVRLYSAYCAEDLGKLVAECPAISRINLTVSEIFFSDTIKRDLSITFDSFQEKDFKNHKPSATLLRAVCGVTKVAIDGISYSERDAEDDEFGKNILLLEHMAAASSKLPRAERQASKTHMRSSQKTDERSTTLTSAHFDRFSGSPRPEEEQVLRVEELPETLAHLSALLDDDLARFVELLKKNRTALLEFVKELKSGRAKGDE